jgi:hypothetical protein
MKKLLFFLFLICFYGYSQDLKKEILIDINNDTINSETFLKKLKRSDVGFSIFESDSINRLKLVKSNKRLELFEHYKLGKLDSSLKTEIFSELELLTDTKIDLSDIIVINFYIDEKAVNQRPCIEFYLSDYKYKNFFKKNKNVKQFFVTDKTYHYDSIKTIIDKNKIIEDLVFSDALKCGNYIIIFPNNNYIVKHGEYRQEVILEFINDYKEGNLEILFN